MSKMFSYTGRNATTFSLDLGNKFDMSNVTNTAYMFWWAANKTMNSFTLDLSGGNFIKVTDNTYMFAWFPANKATIYVKDATARQWIINQNSGFNAANVLIK